ncbi:MAG: hypothetical protein HYR58_05210 [Acidobacteria bacterium]|nr:hypothetical protein [Acidobacteriota bacterium]
MADTNKPEHTTRRTSKVGLLIGGLLIALLLAAVFTLGSLRIPFEPDRWQEFLILYAVSTFMVAALLVFGLIFARTLLRTWAERRAEKLGGRFKTKMVAGAMAIALLPVVFMFFISYALLNRTLSRWFPRPCGELTLFPRYLHSRKGRSRRRPHSNKYLSKARSNSAQRGRSLGVAGAPLSWCPRTHGATSWGERLASCRTNIAG